MVKRYSSEYITMFSNLIKKIEYVYNLKIILEFNSKYDPEILNWGNIIQNAHKHTGYLTVLVLEQELKEIKRFIYEEVDLNKVCEDLLFFEEQLRLKKKRN